MAIRKLLLLLKPIDPYPFLQSQGVSLIKNPQVLQYLESRCKVHRNAINLCQEILSKKPVEWKHFSRIDLSQPIRDVDMVITVGGDGTLLHASHFIDDSVPVLCVNSDPTQAHEVEELSDQFDASRSTGHLCAATVDNFEQVTSNISSVMFEHCFGDLHDFFHHQYKEGSNTSMNRAPDQSSFLRSRRSKALYQFKQQKLPAYKPVLTPKSVIKCFH